MDEITATPEEIAEAVAEVYAENDRRDLRDARATIAALRAEVERLKGCVVQLGDLVDRFAGEGIFFEDMPEPSDVISGIMEQIQPGADWPTARAALGDAP